MAAILRRYKIHHPDGPPSSSSTVTTRTDVSHLTRDAAAFPGKPLTWRWRPCRRRPHRDRRPCTGPALDRAITGIGSRRRLNECRAGGSHRVPV
ncbi:hypothetical protein PoB_003130000 [Plakobranchus ocellatus]|uniref:Uncharacterized protein n=1 Tax=Plakobranchus ocellatus TaxID=259542 RepID=A0AAV4A9E7_9GAST|nr:hypothetical protein PoB_003130000 [Plakobranchus ocellatus]